MKKKSRLRLRDLRNAYRLILECREFGREPRKWRTHLFEGLRRLTAAQVALGGEARLLPEMHLLPEPTRGVIDLGWPDAQGRLRFLEFMQKHDSLRDETCQATDRLMLPLLAHPIRGGRRRVVTRARRQLLDDEAYYRSFAFRQYRLKCGIDDQLLSIGQLGRHMVHCIALHRALGDDPFSDRDRHMLHWLHCELLPMMGRGLARGARVRDDEPLLTPRLREVLEYLLAGDSEKQIAWRLGLSPATVHEHIKRLHRRFNVSSRGELLAVSRDTVETAFTLPSETPTA